VKSFGGRLASNMKRCHADSLAAIALCLLVLSGCDAADTMSGFEHSTAVSTDLERSVGAKPFVGFNWNNGSLRQVTIPSERSLNGNRWKRSPNFHALRFRSTSAGATNDHRRIHHLAMTTWSH
jgi:hypothetical protein